MSDAAILRGDTKLSTPQPATIDPDAILVLEQGPQDTRRHAWIKVENTAIGK